MIDRQLVPVATSSAVEELRLRARVDELRGEVASAASELEQLRTTLAMFEARYDARIGVRIVELDAIELEIVRFRRRLEAARLDEHGRRIAEERIERDLAAEHERIEQEARDAANATRRATSLPAEPAPAVMRSLRQQYRKLARQFHPDIAASEDERASNEQAMRSINAAMERNDLDALTLLEAQLPARHSEIPGPTPHERVRWLLSEITRLEDVFARTTAECAALKVSSVYRLWSRVERDPSLLDRLEADLSRDIATALMEVRALQRDYEHALTLWLTPEEAPL